MKVAYRGQLDAIDQWLRDINNKLTMGISPTFLLDDCQKMQTTVSGSDQRFHFSCHVLYARP